MAHNKCSFGLPNALFDLPSLHYLDLSNNNMELRELTPIVRELAVMEKVWGLDITHNRWFHRYYTSYDELKDELIANGKEHTLRPMPDAQVGGLLIYPRRMCTLTARN